MPAIGGVGKIIEAWPGVVLFHEYVLYPYEEVSLQVADLGQASKDGFIVDGVVPRPPTFELILC